MKKYYMRQRRNNDCRYMSWSGQCDDDYYDHDYCGHDDYHYDDYDRDDYDENCRCGSDFMSARWQGFSEGHQNLNCSNGFRVRFNYAVSEPERDFMLSRDESVITVRKAGVYKVRYSILVPARASAEVEFFVTQNNIPIPSTRTFVSSEACSSRVFSAEAVVRLRAGARLSLRSSDNYYAQAPKPCMTMASMSISRIR